MLSYFNGNVTTYKQVLDSYIISMTLVTIWQKSLQFLPMPWKESVCQNGNSYLLV